MRKIVGGVLILHFSLYGVVSVEPVEPGEKTGLSGEVDAAFKESSGNIERKDYSGGAKLQYDFLARSDFIVANSLYAESDGEAIENNSFAHLRHLESLADGFVWEAYAQSESNDFINLPLRQLVGTGPRFRFFNTENIRLYFGIGAYASTERYRLAGREVEEYKNRANTYLSYKQKATEQFEASATVYWQPALDDGSDYYLLANGNLKLYITRKLHVKLSLGAKEDTNPFEGNKKTDNYYVLGLGYTF